MVNNAIKLHLTQSHHPVSALNHDLETSSLLIAICLMAAAGCGAESGQKEEPPGASGACAHEPAPCGEHSERRDGRCQCSSGYLEAGGACIAIVEEVSCGDRGHRHGATCVCLAGSIYSAADDTCVAVGAPPIHAALRYIILPLGGADTSSGMNAANDPLQVTGNKRPAVGLSELSAYTQSIWFTGGIYSPGTAIDLGILTDESLGFVSRQSCEKCNRIAFMKTF